MRIRINGQWQDQPQDSTVTLLLEGLGLEPRRVAVELNRQLVPRAKFGLTRLGENDELEIVTLVGGG
jgi:thiamine biosynthesis protein ThiS